jgi:hypothetical protein
LQLAVSAYAEVDRLRGLGACNTAIKACKLFSKVLEKKKGDRTTIKNIGTLVGDNQYYLLLLILNELREQANKEPLGLEETKD